VLPLAESAPYSPAGGTHDYSGDGHIEQVTLMHSGNTNDTTSANPDLGHHHATLSVASHVHYHSIDDHTLIYGYSTADPDLTYSGAVLEFNINGETSGGLVWRQGSIFSGAGVTAWYELDITDLVRDPVTKRPYDESIFIDVWPELAAQDAAFSCNVDIQVQIRSVLQQKATF
jgi:hypothetical protein